MKKTLFNIMLLIFTLTIAACSNEKIETNMSSTVADFEFTDQHNEAFASEQLKDDWWIAYFFYTNCTMVCPQTTANIVNVQTTLSDEGITPSIIGFSVDPDTDTPTVLQDYAAIYGANLETMTFLTGYEFDTIKELSNKSFKTVLDGGGPEGHAYAHSTSFFLINPKGEVIKRYDGLSQSDLEKLIADVKNIM
ncbi:SCO family protein [Ornithinibacillus sp. 4-3]|uniref:SCO family protein n=1 Tax=Ornithinibacillus sp. 4-3 TaxID=3231488 RepID=A0AB39HQY8_9BACI